MSVATQFKKGQHVSPETEFKKGQHWRPHSKHREKAFLLLEYIEKQRTGPDIAAQFGIKPSSVYFWLRRHGIPGRSISEVRSIKHWGASGTSNPMYGKRDILNRNWKGGLTPSRQKIYASAEWTKLARDVRRRDKVCRLCGSNERAEIHHIDPFSQCPLLVLDIGNVILLCLKCHRKMHGKEQRWKRRLLKILECGKEV